MKSPFKNRELIIGKLKDIIMKFCFAFTIFVFIIALTPVANIMAALLIVDTNIKPQKSELIAVLGGGAYSNGVLGGASAERFIYGLQLYKSGYGDKILFSGGSIVKFTDKLAHTITKSEDSSAITVTEARIMYDNAKSFGIEKDNIFYDGLSTHTYSNLVNIKNFVEEESVKSCLVVTSPTHMIRAKKVMDKIGLECVATPVDDYTWNIKSMVGRIGLFWTVSWEYAGLILYKLYGYI